MVSICSVKVENTCRSPTDLGAQNPREFLARPDGYRQQWCECSWSARSEEGTVSDNQAGAHRAYIEDNEDPVQLELPSGNGLLVIRRVKNSRSDIASALFDDLVLYFRDGPVIESMVGRNYSIVGPTYVVN